MAKARCNDARLNYNAQAVAALEIIEVLSRNSGNINHGPSHGPEALRIVENHALRMRRAPQPAGERIRVGVNDIDMNQIVRTSISLDPIPVVAADQPDIFKGR